MEAKKSYIRYVAHELRTPLNSASLGVNWLLNTLEDIQDKEDLDLELQETATDVSKALKVAVEILTDMMTISKIESGAMTLHKRDLGAEVFVQDCVAAVTAEARERGLTVEVKPLATGLGQSPTQPLPSSRKANSISTGHRLVGAMAKSLRRPSAAPLVNSAMRPIPPQPQPPSQLKTQPPSQPPSHPPSQPPSHPSPRPPPRPHVGYGDERRALEEAGWTGLLFPEARELTPLDVVSADKFKVRGLP